MLNVDISGNDPGEVEILPQLVREIKKITNPSDMIQLSTHGMTLSNKAFLINLLESGVNSFRIPIYGCNKSIHDKITQNKGSFNLLLRAILNVGYFRKKYPQKIKKVVFVTMILKENQSHLGKLIEFVLNLGFIDEIHLGIAGFVPDKNYYLPHVPDFNKLSKQLGNVLKKKRTKINKAGLDVILCDIPPCISQVDWPTIYFKPPFRGYSHFKKEDEEPPIYMAKEKKSLCQKCFYEKKCPGFFKTYLDNDLINLEPVFKKLD